MIGRRGVPWTALRGTSNQSDYISHYVANLYEDGPARSSASEAEYQALIKEFKLDEQKKVTRDFPINEAVEELVSKNGSADNK